MLSVPASSGANLGYVLLILGTSAFLAGLATAELVSIVLQAFAALAVGGLVASAMLASPALGGVVLVGAVDIPFYMAHFGLPFLLIGLLLDVVIGLVGYGVREWALLTSLRDEPPPWATHRK